MKPWLFFFFFSLISVVSKAQSPHFEKYSLTRRNEGPQINKIFQSREGYIWYATTKGLFRFDGHAYKTFGLAESLPDLNVTAIAQDSLGQIWTAHSSGKIAYMKENRFYLFEPQEGLSPSPVSDIVFDRANVMWFSTLNDGLYYYRNDRLFRLDNEDGLPDLYVYDLEISGDGKLYAGTDGGLAICSLLPKEVKIEVVNQRNGLPDNIVKKITVTEGNILLLGTEDKGVIRYDPASKSISQISGGLGLASVSDIVVKSGKAWVSSSQAGIYVIDLKNNAAKYYNTSDAEMLPVISCLWVDTESNIWAGSRGFAFRTLGDELEFISMVSADANVMAVARDKNDAIWFSTPEGLFKRSQVSIGGYRTTKPLLGTPFLNHRVISLYVDGSGFIWAGLYGEGALRIDPANNKVTPLSKQLRNGNVLNVSGKENVVWLATLGGAEKITIDGDRLDVRHFSIENGLASDFIYQVFVDSKNRVWFGTDGKGVDMLDATGLHHIDNGLPSKTVYSFAEDLRGTIWASTQDAGLCYFTGEKFVDARQDSIPFRDMNNFVLASDPAGRIIAMHNSGIDLYDPASREMRYLDEKSGLERHVANLNSFYRGAEQVFFGTADGIVVLGNNTQRNAQPQMHIDGISLVGQKKLLDISNALTHNQNNLTIHFKGFWYQNPDDVSFAYKMDDYDADWIITGDENITYSQLPPGRYTFRLRSSAGASGGEKTITFEITPPFWRTVWFILSMAVAAAALIYSYIKYRERSLKMAKLLLEEKVEERTLELQRNAEEIQAQNEEIMAQAEEIKGINENLEMLVHERTAELEKKNRTLEEYAFINAHKLRSPVASILGLVNLLNKAEMNDECRVINKHLLNSADELDEIVRSISRVIERGERPGS